MLDPNSQKWQVNLWPYKEKRENRLKFGELATEFLLSLSLLVLANESLDTQVVSYGLITLQGWLYFTLIFSL